MYIQSAYAELEDDSSVATKAEARNRVYWTKVLIDPNVSADKSSRGALARFIFSKFKRLGVYWLDHNRELQSHVLTIKCVRANVII
jgi:hypothetical protein